MLQKQFGDSLKASSGLLKYMSLRVATPMLPTDYSGMTAEQIKTIEDGIVT